MHFKNALHLDENQSYKHDYVLKKNSLFSTKTHQNDFLSNIIIFFREICNCLQPNSEPAFLSRWQTRVFVEMGRYDFIIAVALESHRTSSSFQPPEGHTAPTYLCITTFPCFVVFGAKNTPRDQRLEKSRPTLTCRQKLCICLDRQNIQPLWFPSLCPDGGFEKCLWWRARTSVFPVDICKGLHYCQVLEGSCSLLSFPPNLVGQLEELWGAGRAAENLCLTPTNLTSPPPPSAGLRRAPAKPLGAGRAPLGSADNGLLWTALWRDALLVATNGSRKRAVKGDGRRRP